MPFAVMFLNLKMTNGCSGGSGTFSFGGRVVRGHGFGLEGIPSEQLHIV